jgi:hypothetical protein
MKKGTPVAAAAALAVLGACESTPKATDRGRAADETSLEGILGTRSGDSVISAVRAWVQQRGPIPFDNQTLPIVSPDGRFVATQVGEPIEWSMVIAQRGGTIPDTSRIEVYQLGEEPGSAPLLHQIIDEPGMLGRSSNATGFLIEVPRPNGARWIGLVPWQGGNVKWLARDDGAVSAFGCLGPDGRLAYCRRSLDSDRYDLVVEHRGTSWTLPASDGQWLMPTWSGRGSGLFALSLRNGALDVVHMGASDRNNVRRTLRRVPIVAEGASLATAFQTLGAHATVAGGQPATTERLFFFHPARTALRAATGAPTGEVLLLDEKSLCAAGDALDDHHVLVTTQTDLRRRRPDDARANIRLLAGMQIPRRTTADDRPYVLFQPSDRVVGVTILGLLPQED